MRRKLFALQRVPMVLSFGVAVVAIARELTRPAGQRTWHGRVLGFIPYDFRLPTVERIRARLWNPDDPHLVTGQVFGVGWSVNLYQVKKRLSSASRKR